MEEPSEGLVLGEWRGTHGALNPKPLLYGCVAALQGVGRHVQGRKGGGLVWQRKNRDPLK